MKSKVKTSRKIREQRAHGCHLFPPYSFLAALFLSCSSLLRFAFCILTFDFFFRLFAFPLLAFLFVGCGYHFSGGGTLPQGVKKISLAEIDNETLEVGTEKQLQWAIEQEFRKRGTAIVDDDGEGVLNVTMHQLDLRPLSFDSHDQVVEYQLILLVDVQLIHRETGKMLWQANNLRVQTNYDAVPQVVVTSSPRFLEGNLNAEDLSGLTDIQFSETQRRAAVERLFVETAREVYLRLSENF